ncbi:MAG: tRNA dihydrouridine synthase DusB [Clostridiales bacterium]|nr:tRNA dihydrouridine synthase DusB [Clostridiales bacterium]
MKIGNVEIKNNIFLAPMAGITDKAFRKICAEQNAGLVYTEMISSKGIYYNDKKTIELMDTDIEGMPRAVQIFGNDPYIISEAIRKIEDNADIIDINMGCPAPKVTSNGEGSSLLKEPKLIGDIVRSAVSSTNKPITVKIRKGWDDTQVNASEVAKIIEEAGASLITIHGRTRQEFYSGTCDLDIIRQVKESVSIPVIGNGDIEDYESAKKMFDYTNVDGIMIGRASLGNPWVFNKIIEKDLNNIDIEISDKEKYEMILKHYELCIKNKGEYTAIREMRKHIAWYIKGMKNNSNMKNIINSLENIDEIYKVLKEYFEM